jgi:hypothetical protein
MESFEWVDLIMYSILPFTIMLICSFLIIKALYESAKRLNRLKKQQKDKESIENLTILNNNKTSVTNRQKHKHLSYTLITLNFIFFILISPLVIVLVISKNITDESKILLNTVYLLAYSNHSLNFFLYAFSSPPFRHQASQLISFRKKANTNENELTQRKKNKQCITAV